MDPNTGFPAGFPVPSQSPQNQQMPFYPSSMPQYHQQQPPSQQQQHSFGAMPMQPGPGGAMMPSGFLQQSPENFSAPYAQQHIPATMNQFAQQGSTAPNVPSTVAQTFSQNMASLNANNLLANQPKPTQQLNAFPQTGSQPMSPAQAQAQAQAAARDKARVTTLLEINSALLQEVVNLQAAGKAGPASNQDANASPNPEQAADASKKPSQEYIECMRRLQANLAYLATIADRAKKSGGVAPTAPAIMTPPPNLPAVNEMYSRLHELFPRTGKGANVTPQAKLSPQTMQGNGQPSPATMTESVV